MTNSRDNVMSACNSDNKNAFDYEELTGDIKSKKFGWVQNQSFNPITSDKHKARESSKNIEGYFYTDLTDSFSFFNKII